MANSNSMTTNHKLIIGLVAAYAAFVYARHKGIFGVSGIGAIKRAPRRIWAEVEAAQRAGVNLNKSKYEDLLRGEQEELFNIARSFGYKGSKAAQAHLEPLAKGYFNSLRRAYKSIAGTDLPYDQSVVRNENGDVILIYNDYHLDQIPERAIEEMKDNWWSPNLSDKEAMMQTIADIASGNLKFIWSSKGVKRGVEKMVFGKAAPQERKQRISYLASEAKGGVTPEEYAHRLWERTDGQADDMEILDGVLEAIRQTPSVGAAREACVWEYLKNHTTDNGGLLYADVPF